MSNIFYDPVFFLVVDGSGGMADPLCQKPRPGACFIIMGSLNAANYHVSGYEVYELGALKRVTKFEVDVSSDYPAV